MNLFIPQANYSAEFKPIKGIYAWASSGGCSYGGGCIDCVFLDIRHDCGTLIIKTFTEFDYSPSQAFIFKNNKLKLIQIEDYINQYPEMFV